MHKRQSKEIELSLNSISSDNLDTKSTCYSNFRWIPEVFLTKAIRYSSILVHFARYLTGFHLYFLSCFSKMEYSPVRVARELESI